MSTQSIPYRRILLPVALLVAILFLLPPALPVAGGAAAVTIETPPAAPVPAVLEVAPASGILHSDTGRPREMNATGDGARELVLLPMASLYPSDAVGRAAIDVGLDPGSSTWISGGTDVWQQYCFGLIGHPTSIVTRVRNNSSVYVDSIQVTCTITLWEDGGSWDGGPLVWTNTINTTVMPGVGTLSEVVEFLWTPYKANSYIINLSVSAPNDRDPGNNRGFWVGEKYYAGGNYFTTGEWVGSYLDTSDDMSRLSGDTGTLNRWHVAPDVVMDRGGSQHTTPEAFYPGNDDTDNCVGVTVPVSVTTPPISLVDYDPYALDPESQAPSPQIYFCYKFAGNIPKNVGDSLWVMISDDGGQNWTSVFTDELGNPIGHNGSTFNSQISKFEWHHYGHFDHFEDRLFPGIYIGDHVGKEILIKFIYDPGDLSTDNSRGFWIDDLVVWGRQTMVKRGFELQLPDRMYVDLNITTGVALFEFQVRNLECGTQPIHVSLDRHPAGWDPRDQVDIENDVFLMENASMNVTYDVRVTITPPGMVEGGTYDFTLGLTGHVVISVSFDVLVPRTTGITAQLSRSVLELGLGASGSVNITMNNLGNIDQEVSLLTLNDTDGWILVPDPDLILPVFSYENSSLTVTVPDPTPSGDHLFSVRVISHADNDTIELPLIVRVLEYHDLAVFMGNPVQSIRFSENISRIGSTEFMVHVLNRGNTNEHLNLTLLPGLYGDRDVSYQYAGLDAPDSEVVLDAYNDTGKDIILRISFPYGVSEEYHNFTVVVEGDGPDMVPENNMVHISVKVEYPEKKLVDLGFGRLLLTPSPAFAGEEVRCNISLTNSGVSPARGLSYEIWVDNDRILSQSMGELGSGEFIEIEKYHTFDRGGSYNVTFKLYPHGNTSELDTSFVSTLLLVHQIELSPSGLVLVQGNRIFANTSGGSMDSPVAGSTVSLKFNVTNSGSTDARNIKVFVRVDVLMNDTFVPFRNETLDLEALLPNSSVTTSFDFTLLKDGASYRVTLIIDPDNRYLETNEGDNSMLLQFHSREPEARSSFGSWPLVFAGLIVLVFSIILVLLFIRGLRNDDDNGSLGIEDEPIDPQVFSDSDELEAEIDENTPPKGNDASVPSGDEDGIPEDILGTHGHKEVRTKEAPKR